MHLFKALTISIFLGASLTLPAQTFKIGQLSKSSKSKTTQTSKVSPNAKSYTLEVSEQKIVFEKPYAFVSDVFYFGKGDNPLRNLFVVPKVLGKKDGKLVDYKSQVMRYVDTSENTIVAIYQEGETNFADLYVLTPEKTFALSVTLLGGKVENESPKASATDSSKQNSETEKSKTPTKKKSAKKSSKSKKMTLKDLFNKKKKSANSENVDESERENAENLEVAEEVESPESNTEIESFLDGDNLDVKMPNSYDYAINMRYISFPKVVDSKKTQRKVMGDFTISEFKNEDEAVCKIKITAKSQKNSVCELNLKPVQYLKYDFDGETLSITLEDDTIFSLTKNSN